MTGISIEQATVEIHDCVIPDALYDEIIQTVPRVGWKFGWHSDISSALYWHHEIAGGDKANTCDMTDAVNRHPLPVFSRYVEWLRKEIVGTDAVLLRLYLNGHTFGTDGSPHSDTDREGEKTFVLFLTKNWRPEWGGETVIFDRKGDIEKAVMPRMNRLIAFPSERLHAPRPLSKLFGGLRVVLVAKFGSPPPPPA